MSKDASVQVDLTQEIRFAVVMYGGSSLAIYMNGVAQELLKLVRATAPDLHDSSKLHVQNASGSELVYRRLGQMLSQNEPADLNEDSTHPVRTRFVIDVLSGTSAGGINSVFLAKALANDVTLEGLRGVWLDTADLGELFNDNSGGGTPQNPPAALVNSPFFYQKLLDAFRAMDREQQSSRSPYVEQLDLFTTYTDMQGQTIALKLADIVATERRHLQNFHFTYSTAEMTGEDRNDFTARYTPFLAFAARCTSAHPAAFEPMTLADIEKSGCDAGDSEWERFFQSYLETMPTSDEAMSRNVLSSRFRQRPLCDGGVLDNSPFSFAIDQIQYRQSRLPVDRKLIYIEPSPEHPELEVDGNQKPDAIQNAIASLSTLPSYQSIREDIRRILDRNFLVGRVQRILKGIEEDYNHLRASGNELPLINAAEFRKATFDDMIRTMGAAWGGYQRLRVAETTDELARIVSLASGFNPESDESVAVQYIVRQWRSTHFGVRPAGKQESENQFLYRFDYMRPIRRLKFVLQKAVDLACLNLDAIGRGTIASSPDVESWFRANANDRSPAIRNAVRKQLPEVVRQINQVLRSLYQMQRLLSSPITDPRVTDHPLRAAIIALSLDRKDLKQILKNDTDAKRLEAAGELLRSRSAAVQTLIDRIVIEIDLIHKSTLRMHGADDVQEDGAPVKGILQAPEERKWKPEQAEFAEFLIKSTLRYYYDHFDSYDMVSYPILYSTGVGDERDAIDIFRISPEDVQSPEFTPQQRRSKLAGLSLGHFGALLDKRFRVNDMIWGRLDCADRMITALLRSAGGNIPVETLERTRRQLVQQAQEAILLEEIALLDAATKTELGFGGKPGEASSLSMVNAVTEIRQSNLSPGVKQILESSLRGNNPLQLFALNYKSLHTQNPRKLLEVAGRASRILGNMLDDIAARHRIENASVSWITRTMRFFWGFVEISLPDTIQNQIAHHYLKLLYLFEVLMIVGGLLFSTPAVQHMGVLALGATVVLNAVVLIFQDLAKGRKRAVRIAGFVVGTILVLACLLGLVVVVSGLRADSLADFGRSLYRLITQ
jgi:patatin-related protein